MRARGLAAPMTLCLLAGLSSSCAWFRKPAVKPPVAPPRVFRPPAPQPPENLNAIVLPQPPPIVAEIEIVSPPIQAHVLTAADVPPFRPPRRTGSVKKESVAPVEAPPAETIADAPQLGQILSPEQRREYEQEVRANLERAQQKVATARRHSTTPAQRSAVVRVETFIRQAEQARQTDLVLARSLAERAALLADDLVAAPQ